MLTPKTDAFLRVTMKPPNRPCMLPTRSERARARAEPEARELFRQVSSGYQGEWAVCQLEGNWPFPKHVCSTARSFLRASRS